MSSILRAANRLPMLMLNFGAATLLYVLLSYITAQMIDGSRVFTPVFKLKAMAMDLEPHS